MQLTESVFTPERQQINTVRRAHLCLTGKPSSWAKGANEPAREGKGRWQPHPWGRGGLVHQEVLLRGQIAEGWQAGGFTEPYFFFLTESRAGGAGACSAGEVDSEMPGWKRSWEHCLPQAEARLSGPPAEEGITFDQESAELPGS